MINDSHPAINYKFCYICRLSFKYIMICYICVSWDLFNIILDLPLICFMYYDAELSFLYFLYLVMAQCMNLNEVLKNFYEFSLSVYFFSQECALVVYSLSSKSECIGNALLPYDTGFLIQSLCLVYFFIWPTLSFNFSWYWGYLVNASPFFHLTQVFFIIRLWC